MDLYGTDTGLHLYCYGHFVTIQTAAEGVKN